MEDIAPALLEKILEDFSGGVEKSEVVQRFYDLLDAGKADYEAAASAAKEIGEALADSFQKNLSSDVLPDGKMYYNIAQRVVGTPLTRDYNAVADIAESTQECLNKNAGIGIKAIRPELKQDRIDGIVNRVSNTENFEDIRWILDAPVRNFTQSIIDDAVKANADFQSDAGLHPKIVRKASGSCCKWCRALAGSYDYPEDTPDDVFRRHDNCNCTVSYEPGDGRKQDAWTKKWTYQKDSDKIETRKELNRAYKRSANMPPDERARAIDEWQKHTEIDIPQSEKEHVYEELDNNLTIEEKESAIVSRPIGDHRYIAINKGHNQYKIIEKEPIIKTTGDTTIDDVLDEVLDFDWRELL